MGNPRSGYQRNGEYLLAADSEERFHAAWEDGRDDVDVDDERWSDEFGDYGWRA